jgi:hypothetical protein
VKPCPQSCQSLFENYLDIYNMATMFTPKRPRQEDSFYDYTFPDPFTSPTNALFPPDLFHPNNINHNLNIPQSNQTHRTSLSASSDQSYTYQPYLSRPPSLSPSQVNGSILSHSPHSHSSASPSSNFSLNATDDVLLSNSFTQGELERLFFNTDQGTGVGTAGKGGLYLPQNGFDLGLQGNDTYQGFGNGNGNGNDEIFEQLNFPGDGSNYAGSVGGDRRFSVVSNQSYGGMPVTVLPQQVQQTMQPQWMQQGQGNGNVTVNGNGWNEVQGIMRDSTQSKLIHPPIRQCLLCRSNTIPYIVRSPSCSPSSTPSSNTSTVANTTSSARTFPGRSGAASPHHRP